MEENKGGSFFEKERYCPNCKHNVYPVIGFWSLAWKLLIIAIIFIVFQSAATYGPQTQASLANLDRSTTNLNNAMGPIPSAIFGFIINIILPLTLLYIIINSSKKCPSCRTPMKNLKPKNSF